MRITHTHRTYAKMGMFYKLKQYGITQKDFALYIGVIPAVVTWWKSKTSGISMDNVTKIMDFFNKIEVTEFEELFTIKSKGVNFGTKKNV